jgi:hypothetical protein
MSILPSEGLFRYRSGASSSDLFPSSPKNDRELPAGLKVKKDCLRDLGLDALPNDLTRMLYLASLRDCNNGSYLHPHLSSRMGTEGADRALRDCHNQVFRCLLATQPSEYVRQLQEYIRYAKVEKSAVLETWQSLQAYRATVPMRALPLYCELFCLNIQIALIILTGEESPANAASQEAASRCV